MQLVAFRAATGPVLTVATLRFGFVAAEIAAVAAIHVGLLVTCRTGCAGCTAPNWRGTAGRDARGGTYACAAPPVVKCQTMAGVAAVVIVAADLFAVSPRPRSVSVIDCWPIVRKKNRHE